jgi:tetratricopeptide (TPR) repeat protein
MDILLTFLIGTLFSVLTFQFFRGKGKIAQYIRVWSLPVFLIILIMSSPILYWQWESTIGFQEVYQGHPNEAIIHYQKALKLWPSDSQTRLWLGNSYLDLKQYSKAIEQYSLSIDAYNRGPLIQFLFRPRRRWPSVWHELASAYRKRGFVHMILHEYEQAIDDYTNCIYWKQKAIDADWFDSLIYKNKVNSYPLYLRSLCYYATGQEELAKKDSEQLEKQGQAGLSNGVATRDNFYGRLKCIEEGRPDWTAP